MVIELFMVHIHIYIEVLMSILYKYFIVDLVGKLQMHIDTPGCIHIKCGIKCDWFADTINCTHMFDELPYHLVEF